MSFRETLSTFVAAGASGFWVTTHEEHRVLPEIKPVFGPSYRQVIWSIASGLCHWHERGRVLIAPTNDFGYVGLSPVLSYIHAGGLEEKDEKKPIVVVLRDPHDSLSGESKAVNIRLLREIIEDKKATVVIVSPSRNLPLEVEHCMQFVEFGLPTESEMASTIAREVDVPHDGLVQLAQSARGLTAHEAVIHIKSSMAVHGRNWPAISKSVWKTKSRAWASLTGLVEVDLPETQWREIGGLYTYKKYIEGITSTFSAQARTQGVPQSRGSILVGPPGTGKTLVSRAIATQIGCPFMRVTLGRLLDKWVGETSRKTRELFALIAALMPVVIQMDEIGSQTVGHDRPGDPGVMAQLMGEWLTWLEEHEDGVYIVGTTNQPWLLPSHFMRAGRFDAPPWYVGFPGEDALLETMAIHLGQYKAVRLMDAPEMGNIIQDMQERKFVGAEVREVVVQTVRSDYPATPSIKTLGRVAARMIPTSVIQAEEVDKIERWARERAQVA